MTVTSVYIHLFSQLNSSLLYGKHTILPSHTAQMSFNSCVHCEAIPTLFTHRRVLATLRTGDTIAGLCEV